MAVELRNRLQTDLGNDVQVTAATVFNYPTAETLAGHVADVMFPAATTNGDADTSADEQRQAAALDALSENDLGTMLDDRLDRILGDESD